MKIGLHLVVVLSSMSCAMHSQCFAASPAPDLVVMVMASQGPGTRTESGAGIVVSQTATRTVIVTALHVVHPRYEQADASDITVQFSALRGKLFGASLSTPYRDHESDLAVLFVDHANTPGVPTLDNSLFDQAVSPSALDKLPGAKVQVIGASRAPWSLGPSSDTIVRIVGSKLRVRSIEARGGASGGGAFDSFGRLLGMNSFLDPATDELAVVPMATIERRFNTWGLEYRLGIAGAPTGGPELLASLDRMTKIEVLPIPGKSGAYTVALKVPEPLARLQATFRVAFPESLTLEPIELRVAPYSAEALLPPLRLNAELWMDTPDGRKTGPVQRNIDIESLAMAEETGKDYYGRAFAKAARENTLNWFRMNEEIARQGLALAQEANDRSAEAQALVEEGAMLERS